MAHKKEVQMVGNRDSVALSIIKDVPYATQSNTQNLDIYIPASGSKPYPVIVWMHPGGFYEGDKAGPVDLANIGIMQLVKPILARGYAVVSINQRLSHEAIFPAPMYDVKAAIRWIKANAAKYNLSAKKVAAWGSSAGGYFAAFLAASGGVKELEDLSMGNPKQSSRITAAVDWYGPTDFLQMDPQHIQLGQKPLHNDATSPESRLMGEQITKIPKKCQAANPITYVKADHAPIYIQHGKADDIVPYLQSVMLVDKLKAVRGKAEVIFEVIENAGHADPVFFTKENINKMLDFLDKYMK
jgi:acetyl esterase/lipase